MKYALLPIIATLLLPGMGTTQNVGIGTVTPLEKLHVNGNVKADSIKANVLKIAIGAGAGKVLTSDASGNGSWQSGGGAASVKARNGLTITNDSINLGGRLYDSATQIHLAQHEFSLKDIGAISQSLVDNSVTDATLALGTSAITQTFTLPASAEATDVQLNITAVSGGLVTLVLLDNGLVLNTVSKNYPSLFNGFDDFIVNNYLENNKTYTISVTGNANAFVNYAQNANPYAGGASSIGANADLGFKVYGLGEENLLTLSNNKVGIGTNTPAEKLEVNGKVKMTSLQVTNGAVAGKVLTSDASGNALWADNKAAPGTIAFAGSFTGAAGTAIPLAVGWEFVGPYVQVTVNGNQRIIFSASAALGRNTTGSTSFSLDAGYQSIVAGSPVVSATGANYLSFAPAFTASSRDGYSVNVSYKPPAGTFKIGLVLNMNTTGYLNNNDWVSGYYMVVNE